MFILHLFSTVSTQRGENQQDVNLRYAEDYFISFNCTLTEKRRERGNFVQFVVTVCAKNKEMKFSLVSFWGAI